MSEGVSRAELIEYGRMVVTRARGDGPLLLCWHQERPFLFVEGSLLARRFVFRFPESRVGVYTHRVAPSRIADDIMATRESSRA